MSKPKVYISKSNNVDDNVYRKVRTAIAENCEVVIAPDKPYTTENLDSCDIVVGISYNKGYEEPRSDEVEVGKGLYTEMEHAGCNDISSYMYDIRTDTIYLILDMWVINEGAWKFGHGQIRLFDNEDEDHIKLENINVVKDSIKGFKLTNSIPKTVTSNPRRMERKVKKRSLK